MTTINANAVEKEQARLMALPRDEFRTVCEDDVRSGQKPKPGEPMFKIDPVTEAALRESPVIQRYYNMLFQLSRSVEGQLAAARSDLDGKLARMRGRNERDKPEYDETLAKHKLWRGSALRFKTGIEERQVELQGILASTDAAFFAARLEEERNRALMRTLVLEDAIRDHRDHEHDDDCTTECTADRHLWSLVS